MMINESTMQFIANERGKEQLVIDNAKLKFHNFAGAQTEFNVKGNRNIDVILPDNDMAVEMSRKGWNVKVRQPRGNEEEPYYTLNIKVNMDSKWPPRIIQVNRNKQIHYDADMLNGLDDLNITDIGLVINGSAWENERFGKGIKAYLDQMYFRLAPSVFGNKYDVDDSAGDDEEIPF